MTQPLPSSQSARAKAALHHSSLPRKHINGCRLKLRLGGFFLSHTCVVQITDHLLQAVSPGHYVHQVPQQHLLRCGSRKSSDLHHFIWFPAASSGCPALSPFSTWLPLSHPSRTESSFTSFMKTGWTFLFYSVLLVCARTHTYRRTHRWSCSHFPRHSAIKTFGKHYCNVPFTYLSLPSDQDLHERRSWDLNRSRPQFRAQWTHTVSVQQQVPKPCFSLKRRLEVALIWCRRVRFLSLSFPFSNCVLVKYI